jgi:hypothetical protein
MGVGDVSQAQPQGGTSETEATDQAEATQDATQSPASETGATESSAAEAPHSTDPTDDIDQSHQANLQAMSLARAVDTPKGVAEKLESVAKDVAEKVRRAAKNAADRAGDVAATPKDLLGAGAKGGAAADKTKAAAAKPTDEQEKAQEAKGQEIAAQAKKGAEAYPQGGTKDEKKDYIKKAISKSYEGGDAKVKENVDKSLNNPKLKWGGSNGLKPDLGQPQGQAQVSAGHDWCGNWAVSQWKEAGVDAHWTPDGPRGNGVSKLNYATGDQAKREVQPGDIVVYDTRRYDDPTDKTKVTSGVPNHYAIVTGKNPDGSFQTVSGNHTGGGVGEDRVSASKVSGYYRPRPPAP